MLAVDAYIYVCIVVIVVGTKVEINVVLFSVHVVACKVS